MRLFSHITIVSLIYEPFGQNVFIMGM